MQHIKKILILVTAALLLLGLPLAGVTIAGENPVLYLHFPPVTKYVVHASFSWTAFTVISFLIMITVGPLIIVFVQNRSHEKTKRETGPSFPRWGYAGIACGVMFWIIAWTRIDSLASIQRWTFVPLWLSYIITINALSVMRTGTSLMTGKSAFFLKLFPLSALFWWFFEYLNRFVQNWYYTGIGTLSPLQYFLEATLAFSTVLPAVMSTAELLKSIPAIRERFNSLPAVKPSHPRFTALLVFTAAATGLFFIGIYSDYLFPLVWVSPLLIVASLQGLTGEPQIFRTLAKGNWSPIVRFALAALVCGFFWEMWNYFSLARWEYSIPFVHRFLIFEMPVLGYAGYLPFGLECAAIAALIDASENYS